MWSHMGGYRFIDHTADVEFIAHGKTLEETFRNALLALFGTVADTKKLSKSKTPEKKLVIKERAETLEDLLWFVLQDALSNADARGLFFHDAKLRIVQNHTYEIRAECAGRKKEQNLAKLDVKGVSKFDLKVRKLRNGYEASVVLDV